MNEILLKILKDNLQLHICNEVNHCHITVSPYFTHRLYGKNSFKCIQVLPLDDHLDYALVGCIEFCYNKVIELIAEYDATNR